MDLFRLDRDNETNDFSLCWLSNVLVDCLVQSMHVPNTLRAMPEKDSYEMMEMADLEKTRTESALYHDPSRTYDDPHKIKEELRLQLDEAADMYGNIDEAQEHGYVTRGYVSGALSCWML